MANLREHPEAILHLRSPDRDLAVAAVEVTDGATRRLLAAEAWRLQPWYAEQGHSIEDWGTASPLVMLTPKAPGKGVPAPRGDR